MQTLYKYLVLLILSLISFLMIVCNSEKEEEELTMDNLMRIWEAELKSMRIQLKDTNITKINIESALYKAEDGVPSDSSILDDDFYKHSKLFHGLYVDLFTRIADINSYNAVVNACIGCHEKHCPGPLRSIRALRID